MRLQKFLRDKNISSLRKCDTLVQTGKVKVNNRIVKAPTYYLQEKDQVEVYNKQFIYKKENFLPRDKLYLKFHKPRLTLSSHKSQKGKKTIFEIIDKKRIKKTPLFYAGRLDYDTRGLMILSNDGDFIQKLSHPSYGIEKDYIVTTYYEIDFHLLSTLSRKGYRKDDIEYLPFKFEKISSTKIKVTLIEGKKNEIKNIIILIKNKVKDLLRIRVGDYYLNQLKEKEIEIIEYSNERNLN